MKMWISRHYWWVFPVVVLLSLLCVAYALNFSSQYEFEFTIYAILLSMAAICATIISGCVLGYLSSKGKPVRAWLKFSFSVSVCCFLIGPMWIALSNLPPERPPYGSYKLSFSAEEWDIENWFLDLPWDKYTVRQKMLGDLVDNVLPGQTKSSAIELLGADGTLRTKSNSVQYTMGSARTGIGIGYEYLVLEFDENDIYSGWRLYSD